MLRSEEMTEEYARAISRWRYPAPYERYSMRDDPEEIDQLMNGLHRAVIDGSGAPVGFLAFGWAAQVTGEQSREIYHDESFSDIALGLRPDLCGRGLGGALLECAVAFIRELFPEDGVRLTVCEDNLRARRLYEKAGFRDAYTFLHGDGQRYVIMTLAGI